MKSILEFSLPEEEQDHYDALNGTKYKIVLCELDNWLRGLTKYQDLEAIDPAEVRKKIHELTEEYEVKDIHG